MIVYVPASYTLEKNSDFCENDFIKNFSDFGYTKYMPFEHCEHVYRDMRANPCPICGGDTHDIDWDLLREQRRQHREKVGLLYTVREWWSI